MANLALAVLWAFTALGGWAEQGFCGADGVPDPVCAADVHNAVLVSLAAVVPAVGIILTAFAFHRLRREPYRVTGLLTAAAILWVIAEGIVFLGGHLVQAS
ncbi:hypothetical protein [Actinomadura livida]|uniref:Uncharacterized protein n=1 Tax=Actinomadura livida TaxID=79909 RepID=A0A7W7I9M9_9ACTN|nr:MULTISPECIES: hypothetical protein [Actinomadura]MBB4772978.1 hypothetical protein [Actinomadura catellatispora]GGU39900.1 hypothetical protein GCM10010208_75080 [Actinomadura livida]